MEEHRCEKCGKVLSSQYNLERHIRNNSCKVANHECKYCKKRFTDESNMYRHIRKSCSEKKNQEDTKENIYKKLIEMQEKMDEDRKKMEKIENDRKKEQYEIEKLKKEYEELKKKMDTLNNNTVNQNISGNNVICEAYNGNKVINNGTINIQNNITLVAHNKEDISKIKDEMESILKGGFYTTVKLTEAINFNPKYPEYHNVYISNMKDKYAMVYDGKEWTLVTKEELIDQLYDNKKNYIECNLENLINSHKLKQSQINALKRWIDTDDDTPKIKDVKEKIKLLLYNKRNIPLNTKNSISTTSNNAISDIDIKVTKKKTKILKNN